jgi:hypothetical protein
MIDLGRLNGRPSFVCRGLPPLLSLGVIPPLLRRTLPTFAQKEQVGWSDRVNVLPLCHPGRLARLHRVPSAEPHGASILETSPIETASSAMQSVSPMCRDAMRPQGSEPNDGTCRET